MLRRISSIVVAGTIAIAVAVAGATSADAAAVVKVSAPSTYVVGGSAKVSITVSGAYTGTANLQVKASGSWTTAARTIRVTKGKASATVAPSTARTYRIKVGSAYSSEFTVTPVKPGLKASLSKSVITKGQTVTATLTAVPATSGTAKLQVKSGSSWTSAARTVAVTKGKGSTSLAPATTRTYRFAFAGMYSAAFTITVAPPSAVPASFTVKGSGWGHGVGMSQYGAYGMALDGYKAPDILTHYFTGTQVETVPANPDIRVQVFGKGSDNATTVKLIVRSPGTGTDANGAWRMTFASTERAAPTTTWTGHNNEVLTLTRVGSSVKATRENGVTATASAVALQWEATSYFAADSPEDPYVEVQTATGAAATHGLYRHGELLATSTGSRLNIVNVLKLDTEYLLGVAEMPSSWASEALEAQAIAARGYAVREVASGLSASCGCHVYDDASSQNFSGWKKESEGTDASYGKRWVAAVRATQSDDGSQGQVLVYSPGKIATTYYFSSSGGQTENSEDVWSGTISYLRSVDDAWSLAAAVKNPNASWSANVSQATMKSAFGLSDVKSVTITTRTSAANTAAAYQLTAKSSTGATSTLTGADNIRIKLGVKSPWIWSIVAS